MRPNPNYVPNPQAVNEIADYAAANEPESGLAQWRPHIEMVAAEIPV